MIEVGEYVRTNDGHIGKLIRIERDDIDTSLKWYVFNDDKNERYVNKPYVIKHSKSIIDLIEVGDYVNGMKIDDIGEIKRFGKTAQKCLWINIGDGIDIIDEEIKDILTKEQYQANCYKTDTN